LISAVGNAIDEIKMAEGVIRSSTPPAVRDAGFAIAYLVERRAGDDRRRQQVGSG
jgi:hypothetical protein